MPSEPQWSTTDPLDELRCDHGSDEVPDRQTAVDAGLLNGLSDADESKDRST